MVGPRTAKVYPLYDGVKPVDFHFLENYHYRQFEEPDEVPYEGSEVWWPNIIVRLSEVYRTLVQIDLRGEDGVRKFFGFFARPYVRMQEYWILIDEKAFDMPLDKGVEGEQDDVDHMYWSYPDDTLRDKLRQGYEDCVSYDTLKRTPDDIVPVDNVEELNILQKYRLRIVATYLRAWGNRVPVKPRLVKYAVSDEPYSATPPLVVDVVNELDRREPHDRMGLRTIPAVEPR
ncbi:hypothetical protein K445DRAFT_26508 [Daldinia sp. EC12]|nr:hypothetical protein K445DRAFT_26508 [Daldinia sp. EC12]